MKYVKKYLKVIYPNDFTYIWAFDLQEDWDYIHHVENIFESKGGTVYFVELEAELDERLERNKSPNRLEHKPKKEILSGLKII